MKKKEAERLREIADVLDEHFLDVWHSNHKHGWWLHWTAQEIRKVIIDSGLRVYNKEEK